MINVGVQNDQWILKYKRTGPLLPTWTISYIWHSFSCFYFLFRLFVISARNKEFLIWLWFSDQWETLCHKSLWNSLNRRRWHLNILLRIHAAFFLALQNLTTFEMFVVFVEVISSSWFCLTARWFRLTSRSFSIISKLWNTMMSYTRVSLNDVSRPTQLSCWVGKVSFSLIL